MTVWTPKKKKTKVRHIEMVPFHLEFLEAFERHISGWTRSESKPTRLKPCPNVYQNPTRRGFRSSHLWPSWARIGAPGTVRTWRNLWWHLIKAPPARRGTTPARDWPLAQSTERSPSSTRATQLLPLSPALQNRRSLTPACSNYFQISGIDTFHFFFFPFNFSIPLESLCFCV